MPDTEEQEEQTEEQQQEESQEDDTGQLDPKVAAKLHKANQEAKALRTRLKDAEAKASKFDELEESNKTEAQKLADQATEAGKRAEVAEREVMRLRVAARKGLTEAQAKRLVGDSEDDLEADADDLLASFKPAEEQDDEERPPGRPREALRPGAVRDGKPPFDPKKTVEQIPRNRHHL